MTATGGSESERQQQTDWNRQTAGNWQRFAPHRARLTSLLRDLARERTGPRLAVLGAGNTNDLDLPQLLETFAEITLVDWDREAVQRGVARQVGPQESRLRIAAAVDLSEAAADLRVPAAAGWLPAEPFEVVASIGLLSQLMLAACRRIERPADLAARARQVRQRHLECITRWTAKEGDALVTCEIVSSETLPELASAAVVAPLLGPALEAGNFFTGLHPAAVAASFREGTPAGGFRRQEWLSPWRWDLGPRVYAVAALRLLEKQPPDAP